MRINHGKADKYEAYKLKVGNTPTTEEANKLKRLAKHETKTATNNTSFSNFYDVTLSTLQSDKLTKDMKKNIQAEVAKYLPSDFKGRVKDISVENGKIVLCLNNDRKATINKDGSLNIEETKNNYETTGSDDETKELVSTTTTTKTYGTDGKIMTTTSKETYPNGNYESKTLDASGKEIMSAKYDNNEKKLVENSPGKTITYQGNTATVEEGDATTTITYTDSNVGNENRQISSEVRVENGTNKTTETIYSDGKPETETIKEYEDGDTSKLQKETVTNLKDNTISVTEYTGSGSTQTITNNNNNSVLELKKDSSGKKLEEILIENSGKKKTETEFDTPATGQKTVTVTENENGQIKITTQVIGSDNTVISNEVINNDERPDGTEQETINGQQVNVTYQDGKIVKQTCTGTNGVKHELTYSFDPSTGKETTTGVVVQFHESIRDIASKFNVTVTELLQANPGKYKSKNGVTYFYAGATISIPKHVDASDNHIDSRESAETAKQKWEEWNTGHSE